MNTYSQYPRKMRKAQLYTRLKHPTPLMTFYKDSFDYYKQQSDMYQDEFFKSENKLSFLYSLSAILIIICGVLIYKVVSG